MHTLFLPRQQLHSITDKRYLIYIFRNRKIYLLFVIFLANCERYKSSHAPMRVSLHIFQCMNTYLYIFLMNTNSPKYMRTIQSVMSRPGYYVCTICWHRCHLKYAPTWKKFDRSIYGRRCSRTLVQGISTVPLLCQRWFVIYSPLVYFLKVVPLLMISKEVTIWAEGMK